MMPTAVDGIEFPVGADPWAYETQMRRLAETAAARIAAAERAARAGDSVATQQAVSAAQTAARFLVEQAATGRDQRVSQLETALRKAQVTGDEQTLKQAREYADQVAESIGGSGPVATNDQLDAAVGRAVSAGVLPSAADFSAVAPANGARAVGRGELVINAKDFGAAGDGAADDTAALQAAMDAAATRGDAAVLIPAGTYRTTGTLQIACSLQGDTATIDYYGQGTALLVGSDTAGRVTFRRTFHLPRVVNKNRQASQIGWDGSSIGARLMNLNTCTISVPFVRDFEQGLVLYGNGGGMAYSTILLGTLWENHQNLVFACNPSGYVNQNLVIGGRVQLSYSRNQVRDDPNAFQVSMVTENAEGGPNNNTLIGTSIESDGVPLYFLDLAGSYNQFINVRWEAPNATPRVRYRASAERNLIQGGYNAHNIEETFDGARGAGEIRDTQGAYMRATIGTKQQITDALSSVVTAWSAGVGRRCKQDVSSGKFTPRPGRWRVDVTLTFEPNAVGRRAVYIKTQTAGAGATHRTTAELPPAPGTGRTTLRTSTTLRFDGTTDLWVEAFQTSGGLLALETTGGYGVIELEYLGAS